MMLRKMSIGLLILRISLGGLMLFHGLAKIFGGGLGPIKGIMESIGMPGFVAYGAIVGEVVAPLMILAGFRTRIAGAIFAFNMVVAVLSVHAGDLFSLSPMGGYALELQMLYLLGGVALVFTGAGKYAVSTSSLWD